MNGKRGMTGLMRGEFHLPLHKNTPGFKKKDLEVFKKHQSLFIKTPPSFLKHQGLLAALGVSCLFFLMCMYASVNHTYGGVSLHVYTREPARIYVSAHTYVCIRLYVYMLLRPSIPYDNPVWVSRHQGKCVPGDGM